MEKRLSVLLETDKNLRMGEIRMRLRLIHMMDGTEGKRC